MTEWSPLFSEPHPSREFCVQYGETDYDFLCRMAAEEGIFFQTRSTRKKVPTRAWSCATPCVICRSPLRSPGIEHPYRGEHPLHQPVPLQCTNPPFFRGDQGLHL